MIKQARKARRCDSYLQIWNYQLVTDPLLGDANASKNYAKSVFRPRGDKLPFFCYLSIVAAREERIQVIPQYHKYQNTTISQIHKIIK